MLKLKLHLWLNCYLFGYGSPTTLSPGFFVMIEFRWVFCEQLSEVDHSINITELMDLKCSITVRSREDLIQNSSFRSFRWNKVPESGLIVAYEKLNECSRFYRCVRETEWMFYVWSLCTRNWMNDLGLIAVYEKLNECSRFDRCVRETEWMF